MSLSSICVTTLCANHKPAFPHFLFSSVRMGLAFSLVAVANLIGSPIAGELLGRSTHDDGSLTWWTALTFAGVSTLYPHLS